MRKTVFIGVLAVFFVCIVGFFVFSDRFTQSLLQSPIARLLLPEAFIGNQSGSLSEFELSLLSARMKDPEIDTYDKSRRKATEKEIQTLMSWASQNEIVLTGITRSVRILYEDGLQPEQDFTEIPEVPGVWQIDETLSMIPKTLIEILRNRTIYVSTVAEPSFTVIKGNKEGKLKNVNEGIILTQPITPRSILREFAHFLDFQGIQGLSVPRDAQLFGLRDKYRAVFSSTVPYTKEIPEGYMTSLATTNTFENFAEHFTAYILDGDSFRVRASKEPKLAEKYIFLRDQLFERIEY